MREPLLLGLLACTPDPKTPEPPPPPVPAVEVGAPWVLVEESGSHLVFRHATSADGVRVQLARGGDGRGVGVTPVSGGRAWELRRPGGNITPTFAPPWPNLTAAWVESQGPDLLVRLEGPPIKSWSDHPQAPSDPLLSWVRLRIRSDGTWRIVLRGLHDVALPSGEWVESGDEGTLRTSMGAFFLRGKVPGVRTALTADAWLWTSIGALHVQEPYPQMSFTVRPRGVSD